MWTARFEPTAASHVLELRFFEADQCLRQSAVLSLWRSNRDFRSLFIDQLAAVPFESYRWETPAVTTASIDQPFECVVVDAPGLAPVPDWKPFRDHAAQAVDTIAVFPSLGRDATLIVPCPVAEPTAYNHLAAFVRNAPEDQKQALFQRIGVTLQSLLSARPLWLSTAGAGVSWLHVRLDTRPKYYAYAPYRVAR